MYIKSLNPPIINKLNYSLANLIEDNPLTCFNGLIFDGNHDNELLEYRIYKVFDTPPVLETNQKIVDKTIIYDEQNDTFYYEYTIGDKTDEELMQERFNPVQFMEQLADNSLFKQWASTAIIDPAFSFMMIAFQNGKLDRVQVYYNTLKGIYPLPDGASIAWQEIANINGIASLIF